MNDQIDYLWKLKVLLSLAGVFPSATPSSQRWRRIGQAIYSKCVLLLMVHIAGLFCITAVHDCMYQTSADILYSTLQSLVCCHMCFVAWYYQFNADQLFGVLHAVNRGARHRSAPGEFFVSQYVRSIF